MSLGSNFTSAPPPPQKKKAGFLPSQLSVLRDGYRIPFRDLPPPLTGSPVRFPTYRLDSERARALLADIDTMMTKGVLEIVSDPDPGFYSHLFLVEKSSGGWRPVIDFSLLNEFVQQTPFRMETPNSVLLTVRKNDFLVSIDLKDTYFQIPVHPSSRKLLRFVSNDTVYQFKALCFGLSRPTSVHKSFRGGFFLGSSSRNPPAAVVPGRLADLVHLTNQDNTSTNSSHFAAPSAQ